MKNKLVEKAKSRPRVENKRESKYKQNPDTLGLVEAYLNEDIGNADFAYALGKRGASAAYAIVVSILRSAYKNGKLKIG